VKEGQFRVGVVVVNWNRAHDTLAAYMSLKSSTFENWWLYVVDNASEDNSADILGRELDDRATLILNNINSGFSGGCNLAIRRALSEGATHIFLLNNDAAILPSTLGCLLDQSITLNDSAILGCVLKIYGTDNIQFFGSRTRDDVGHPIWFDSADLDKLSQTVIETDFVLGAALFAPATIWRQVGYFDERFYLNYEETDWCYRARKLGIPCYVVPAAVALHKVGATMGPTDGPLQNYFIYRNELLFASHHAKRQQQIRLLFRTVIILIKSAIDDFRCFRKLRPATLAHAIALYDFTRRKSGDCPTVIRQFALQHSAGS
jgi:GT2 family glycosyltransferase